MTHGLQVGVIIESILASFDNGMDVFRRLVPTKSTKRAKSGTRNAADLQLQNSLLNGPKRIRAKYDQNVVTHGQRFVTGDAEIQSSLAKTLLSLNTGLMRIINHALSGGFTPNRMTKNSLLDLSEMTAADTLSAMDNLNDRLVAASKVNLSLAIRPKAFVQKSSSQKGSQVASHASKSPIMDENPLFVRGGWVRTKTGSSIALSAAGARRRAAQKQSKKRPSSNLVRTTRKQTTSTSNFENIETKSSLPLHECSCQMPKPTLKLDNSTADEQYSLPCHSDQRPPSIYLVPADYFSNPAFDNAAPPRPPKVPLSTRPNQITRPRPVSGATFMTASTKIGEIPESHLPDRVLSEEEKRFHPMPYTVPPPLFNLSKKKRRGLWPFKS